MRSLQCEICGGKRFIKKDGVFVCQDCGTHYTVEEAKKLMVDDGDEILPVVASDIPKSNEQLLKQLEIAIALEKDLYTQKRIEDCMLDDYDKNKPLLTLGELPSEPQMPFDLKKKVKFAWAGMAVIGAFLIYLLVMVIRESAANSTPLSEGMARGVVSVGSRVVSLLTTFGPIALIILIVCLIPLVKSWKFAKVHKEYVLTCNKIQKSNSEAQKSYQDEMKKYDSFVANNIEAIRKRAMETKKLLDKLYLQNFIHEKYRTLPALTSIYEYLTTGRCDELKGPHGAYNLFEDEVRKDTIIIQLGRAVENLESIRSRQYLLYEKLLSVDNTLQSIQNELDHIGDVLVDVEHVSAINAYYAEVAARNTEFIAVMGL